MTLHAAALGLAGLGVYGWLDAPGRYGPPLIDCTDEPPTIAAYEAARGWLALLPRTKRPCGWSSYAWKHVFQFETGLYVPNGVFIAAAASIGLAVRRCSPTSPNAWFNLKSPPVRYWARPWAGAVEPQGAAIIPAARGRT